MVHGLAYEGMFMLSSVCIVSIIFFMLYSKGLGKILHVDVDNILMYIDPVSIAGASVGVILLMISLYQGFPSLVSGTLTNSQLRANLTMMVVSIIGLWIIFLIIRAKYGKELWHYGPLSAVCSFIGLAGLFFVLMIGSIRGHLMGQGSILDPMYDLLGISPLQFWTVGAIGISSLIGVCALAGIVFAYAYWKPKVP